jgi:group I intron endonuclease
MAFIYKITNNINQKIYIGKTEFSVEKRFQEHCKDAFKEQKESRPLYSAIKKYGINNFSVEIVEETSKPEEREIFWIDQYNSLNDGYNATLGGDGKRLFDYENIKKLILERKTYSEIKAIIGCSRDTILAVAQQCELTVINATAKRVIGTNKITQEIQIFDSSHEAARWLNSQGHTHSKPQDINSKISQACRGIRKSAYGFYWKYFQMEG